MTGSGDGPRLRREPAGLFASKPRLASPLVPFVYLYGLVGLSTGVAWLASRALQTWKLPATMDGAQTTVGEPARRYHVIHRIEPASPPPVAGARRAPR